MSARRKASRRGAAAIRRTFVLAVVSDEDEPREPASPVCYMREFEVWESDEAEQPMKVRIKRAYEAPSPEDGGRFLVDRVWPRGVKKDDLALSAWLKDVAPSNELRRWYGHEASRWNVFRRRYRAELKSRAEVLRQLRDALDRGTVTLVYSARDEKHNQAVVLREFLLESKPSRRKIRNPKEERTLETNEDGAP